MSDLEDIMRDVRAASKTLSDTVNRILGNREARTTGFRGFPNMYEGDSCVTLTPKERLALTQVREDAIVEEAQSGLSLELLNFFVEELYNERRMELHRMDPVEADAIRNAIVSYMDTKPGTGYSLPGYLRA